MLKLLEDSVDQAPGEIEKEKDRGVGRFGKAFEVGDGSAIIAIQQITIQLQNSLLEKLRNATFDDEYTDFTSLVDESDFGRDRTKSVLFDFRQRLLQAAKIYEISVTANVGQLPVAKVAARSASPKEPHVTVLPDDASEVEEETVVVPEQRRKGSMFDVFKRQKAQIRPKTQHSQSEQLTALPARSSTKNTVEMKEIVRKPTFIYQPHEDNPFEIWGFNSAEQEVGNGITARVDSRLSSAETVVAASLSDKRKTYKLDFGTNPFPTPDNNFRGFCRGAWKLQNGDRKAMTKRLDYSQSAQSKAHLSCTKCGFKCPFNEQVLWNKVFTVPEKGFKLRFSFLVKSHVPHRQFSDAEFYYQCLFCVFDGQEALRMNSRQYLDHIVSEHRGATLNKVVLHRTNCVNSRICNDTEQFDINLFPVADSERSSPREGSLASVLSVGLGESGIGV